MARKRGLLDGKGEAQEVLRRLKSQRAGWQRERLLAVKLGWEGQLGLEEIATAVGRARSTIQLWFDAFREGGLDGLLKKSKGNGPPSRLTGPLREALMADLAKGRWRTAGPIRQWLAERGVQVTLSTVYHYLGKSGARLKVPRPCHAKQDKEEMAAFRDGGLERELEALNLAGTRPVRVWVEDEGRLGLQPITRRAWGLPGQGIVTSVDPRYEWTWVYAALQVGGEGCEFLYAPELNQAGAKVFLEQSSQREPGAIHVVIWDGAGAHPADGSALVPENVRLIPLPAYCPELNPVEKLWDVVKDAVSNIRHADLDALEEGITQVLRTYWEDATRVIRLIGRGWLLSSVNASSPTIIPK